MSSLLTKYADLLVHYCVELQPGEKLFVQSTTLAEPLVREVYRSALRAGAIVEVDLAFREKGRIFLNEASEAALQHLPILQKTAFENFDAYLYIRAPFNLREEQNVNSEKAALRREATKDLNRLYFERTATRSLKRNLCEYPTLAAAQQAGMSLEEFENFVFGACKLFAEDPAEAWRKVRAEQQKVVDLLNKSETIRYLGPDFDLSFSCKGRTWINSDGQTNMPSGEVFTSPVEDSVNGVIRFSFPSIYMGHSVEGVTLWVKDGYIEKWEARQGQDFLDKIFQMEGTRRFGEAAIGTNYDINRITKNILFDEKMGGTVHLAIGQSYLQTGGKNQSTVHWDMITDMTNGGAIFADGTKIYENGKFIF
ncbi:MAG: aminopeptidase [Bacteroidetes bacterium]|nr:MAG: aminopeptidase [Bacteroidota bacterium]